MPELNLKALALHELRSGDLWGAIRPLGHYHGLILFGRGGAPITYPGRCTMNLEHYCETGRCGIFTPRDDVSQSYKVGDDWLTIQFAPTEDWKVKSLLTYQVRDAGVIDITFSFDFLADYPMFEAFIASYFHGALLPFVHAGGRWVRPVIEPREQLFFARDDAVAPIVNDGRWHWLTERGSRPALDERRYDLPLTVHFDDRTGWAFVQMVEEAMCPAVSVNTFAYAQDFSIVGQDVITGKPARVRARVIYHQVADLDDLIEDYRRFEKDIAQ
jgi:hypothetical protein